MINTFYKPCLSLLLIMGTSFGSLAQQTSSCEPDFQQNDILYLGDSISTEWIPYSQSLAKEIAPPNGGRVIRYAVGGSSALNWSTGFRGAFFANNDNTLCDRRSGILSRQVKATAIPGFNRLTEKKSPHAVVIALGTNDINNYCASVKQAQGNISAGAMWIKGARELAAKASAVSRSCIWVLPLTYQEGEIFRNCQSLVRGVPQAIETLKNAVQDSCRVIDSSKVCETKLSFDRVGIHPLKGSDALGSCIGKNVMNALKAEASAHSLLKPASAPSKSGTH